MKMEKKSAIIKATKVFPSVKEGLNKMAYCNGGITQEQQARVIITNAVNEWLENNKDKI